MKINRCFVFVGINPNKKIIYFENKFFDDNSWKINIARDEYFNIYYMACSLGFKIIDIASLSNSDGLEYGLDWDREIEKTKCWIDSGVNIDKFVNFKHILFTRLLEENPDDAPLYKILIFNELYRNKYLNKSCKIKRRYI